MTRPRVAVFAYSEVGWACLDELIALGADVAVVFTHADDPDENIWFRSVADLARSHGIETRAPERIDPSEIGRIRAIAPELIFSFYCRALIPMEVIGMARLGAYNVHGSLLPKYRGRAPINWAVVNGERETGATLHAISDRADAGDIVAQRAFPIARSDTALDVFRKTAAASRELVRENLSALEAGTATLTPQDETKATKFGRRTPKDGEIDWSMSAERIYDLIRGVTRPFPGAFTHIDGKRLFLWRAETEDGDAPPGEIVSRCPLTFGTGSGLLRAEIIQFDGEEERSSL